MIGRGKNRDFVGRACGRTSGFLLGSCSDGAGTETNVRKINSILNFVCHGRQKE